MKKYFRLIISIFFAVLLCSGTIASAAQSELPPGFLIGDDDGIHVTRDGSYFINAVNLRPGDVITKRLTIRNLENDKPFKLTMTAEPLETSGPLDLLDEVHLNIKLDGRQIYDGRIRGDEDVDMIRNALDLGEYAYLDSSIMDITLTVSEDMKLAYEKSEADIAWHFYAVKNEKSDPPKTGENTKYMQIAIVLIIIFMVVSTILLNQKAKKINDENNRQSSEA